MGETRTFELARPLQAVCVLLACGAIAIFAVRSLSGPLWLDELLSLTLIQAASLPKLWSGIVAGIDGNPPLYLTVAWLIAHAVPPALPAVAVLKLTNVALTMAASFALYRIGRRVASAPACWIGTFLFAALNDNLIYVALELRTYALYFLMAALAVLFQQRLIERRQARDIVALALLYAGLTLAHTFGIVYVASIAFAGWLSQIGGGGHHWRRTAAAAVPAVIVLACWIPFFLQQSAVGKPYLWIGPPGLPDLLESLFASKLSMWIAIVELYCLASAAVFAMRRREFQLRSVLDDASWQPFRYVMLVLAGIAGFTVTAWIVSVILFPLFVPRYFAPQLIVSFGLHIGFGEWLVRLAQHRLQSRIAGFAISAIIAPPALFCLTMLSRSPVRGEVPCTNSASAYFEADFVSGDLPVIAESPHVFLPRATYAIHRPAYLFPLDWDVVLKYPERARGNAVDFHILENIRTWSNMDQIASTEDIVSKYPQFLVIEQSGRAWFYNLTTTRNVSAQKLSEVTSADGSQSCTLWKVTSVRPRP
jgi:hypothetical protein